MNSTGINLKQTVNESPIKQVNGDKNDEEWLNSFLEMMDSDNDDDSKFNSVKSF